MNQPQAAPERQKSLADKESSKAFIDFLKTSGFPYSLKISNYTTEIISDLYNIQFMQSMRGKSCFAAYAKVKSDIKGKPIPIIDENLLSYFSHDFKNDFDAETVINIDLKSAYATALFNRGVISETTFMYLGKVSKLDRLASIGMLASKKYIFDYNDLGELVDYRKQVSEYKNFFFYAVQIVEKLMDDLKFICASEYLFTWVDGIYFKVNPETIVEVCQFLEQIDYRYSIETLKNFSVRIVNKKIKLSFDKEGKRKYFNIPAKPSMLANDIVYYLTNKNVKGNESLSIRSGQYGTTEADSVSGTLSH